MAEDSPRTTFKLTNNTTWCKFTVALLDTSNPGQIVPATGSNQGPVAGVAVSSVLATGQSDYASGVFQSSLTGASWPSGYPGSGTLRAVNVQIGGIAKVILGSTGSVGTVAAGDRLVVADATGRVASVEADGLNLSGGTKIHTLGVALEAASTTGQAFRARINILDTTV